MRTDTKTYSRDSNLELLRIVCMLFILMHHFVVHVFYPNLAVCDGNIGWYRAVCVAINGFVFVGVNCFILISGYYGIKFKWKSLFNLYCICAFYALLVVLERCFWQGIPFDRRMLCTVILPFSHSEWWFINCYVILYLLSPLLNKAIEAFSRQEFVLSLVLLTIVNLYFGYYWHQHNVNGFTVGQFIYIYFIGAFLHKYPVKWLTRRNSLLLYVTSAVFWSVVTIASIKWRVPHWCAFYYNNPLVILSSIGLFVFMTTLEIRNPKINAVASGVLAAYLIQDVGDGVIYSLSRMYKNLIEMNLDSEGMRIIAMLAFVVLGSVIVLLFALGIERFRLLLMRPVWQVYGMVRKRFSKTKNFKYDS